LESNKAKNAKKNVVSMCFLSIFLGEEKKKHKEKNCHLYHHPPAIIKGAGGPHSSLAASDKALEAVSLVLRNCHRFTPLKFNTKEPEKSRPWEIRRFRNLENPDMTSGEPCEKFWGEYRKKVLYCSWCRTPA